MDADLEEEGEKPDPNNIYFVDEIFGGVGAEGVHPVGGAGLPRRLRQGGQVRLPVRGHRRRRCSTASTHDVDSSADTFKLAAMECFRDAQAKAGSSLLEPIMNVVVHRPGQVPGRPGRRHQPPPRRDPRTSACDKGRCMLHAYVPLAELFGYTSDLRNFTSGTASFTHGAEPLRAGEGRAGGYSAGVVSSSPKLTGKTTTPLARFRPRRGRWCLFARRNRQELATRL